MADKNGPGRNAIAIMFLAVVLLILTQFIMNEKNQEIERIGKLIAKCTENNETHETKCYMTIKQEPKKDTNNSKYILKEIIIPKGEFENQQKDVTVYQIDARKISQNWEQYKLCGLLCKENE